MNKVIELYDSCDSDNLNKVRELIYEGVNIYAGCNYALQCAAENGHLDIVKYLISKGADFTKLAIVNPVSWLWGKYYE